MTNETAQPTNVGSNDGLGRCTCPPGECHGKGHGPANCAAVAARQKPISEARYVSRLAAAARHAAAAKAAGLWPAMSHNPEAFEAFAAAIEAAERERCARVCELRGRALEAARAHAEGSLQGANPKYWGPLLSLAAELAESIRRA